VSEPAYSGGLYGSDVDDAHLRTAFTSGQIPVAVYGLGKMGLPLAAAYADVAGDVTGVDIDESVVETVNDGGCHVRREPGLPDLVADVVARDALRATTDAASAASAATLHVVIVPTLLSEDRDPDLSTVESVVDAVAAGLSPGDLVVVESTVPPGTCAEVVRPRLVAESGLSRGSFGVAFCPERASSGRALADIRRARPKVVGGVDDESTRAAALVYGELVDNDLVVVSDATTAECVKVFEGLYRDANIALANELARFTDELGVDVREAIDAANTQEFCDIHTPGPGVGGHCIPYYPYFVLNWLATDAPLVRTARGVNDSMPAFVVEKVTEGLRRDGVDPDDATVLVLGLTYRAGVAETRASPAVEVCDGLASRGASVLAADPLVEDGSELEATLVPVDSVQGLDVDAAVLATAHEEFDAVDWTAFEPMTVVDARDAVPASVDSHRVYTVGRGSE
jgi:UDP-N-acetyl-D-mannosaminuronic acid dehydrogenase